MTETNLAYKIVMLRHHARPSGCRLVCGYTQCASEADNVASCKTRRRVVLGFLYHISRPIIRGLVFQDLSAGGSCLRASMTQVEIVLAGARKFRRMRPCDNRHDHVGWRNMEANALPRHKKWEDSELCQHPKQMAKM